MRLLCVILLLSLSTSAYAGDRFNFESIKSVPEMEELIQDKLPLGTPREEVERIFVLQGHATLKHHPTQKDIEKYLYDINLCDYYIFRWNISADFDTGGSLVQAYINGIPVFKDGKPKRPQPVPPPGQKPKVIKSARNWPQAKKGGQRLNFLLFDADGDTTTTDDQMIAGLGATNVDPANFGPGIRYTDVEPWRSIYDDDVSNDIAAYTGSCKEADAKYLSRELMDQHHGYMP